MQLDSLALNDFSHRNSGVNMELHALAFVEHEILEFTWDGHLTLFTVKEVECHIWEYVVFSVENDFFINVV